MAGEFETYAMRGLVAFLGAALVAFIWREITQKDNIWKVMSKNRETFEKALEDARKENQSAMASMVAQFRSAIDPLSATVAGLAQAIGKLDATVAREYATKDDLRDAKDELRREMDNCREACPETCGTACPHVRS